MEQAKVILVERDLDRWYQSFCRQVIDASYTWQVNILIHYIEPYLQTKIATTMTKLEYGWLQTDSQNGLKEKAKQKYVDHYAMVRRLVPKDRLLEYKMGSGWEPLCNFLGKEVPADEFPWLNESKEFQKWMYNIQMRSLRRSLLALSKYLILPGLAISLAWWWTR